MGWNCTHDRKNLVCRYYSNSTQATSSSSGGSNPDPEVIDITYIHFSKQTEGKISVKLIVSSAAPIKYNAKREPISFTDSLAMQIADLADEIEITQEDSGDYALRFKITDIAQELTTFNSIIKILEDKMHDFPSQIKTTRIPEFLNPPRQVIVATAATIRRKRAKSLENHADSNMFGVIVTAMLSEQNLRRMYNFPAPNYSRIHNYEPPAVLADYEEDLPAVLYEDCQPSNYSAAENQAINDLTQRLVGLAQELVNKDYLSFVEGQFALSDSTIYLLKNYHQSDEHIHEELWSEENEDLATVIFSDDEAPLSIQKDKTRLAQDVLTALRALKVSDDPEVTPHGSHSHNGLMSKTKIKGYGIRNVIALLWHACMLSHIVQPSGKNGLLNFDPSENLESRRRNFLEIMARAIANGARGGNRNLVAGFNTTFYENMSAKDEPVCGQGQYNFAFDAFHNVLSGIELIYDVPDLFLNDVKQFIYRKIYEATKDLALAKQFIKVWNGNDRFPLSLRNQALYDGFKRSVRDELQNFKDEFVQRFARGNLEFKQIIDEDLKFHIGEGEALYALLEYPLNENDLVIMWTDRERSSQAARQTPPPPPPGPPPPSSARQSRKLRNGGSHFA